MTPKSGSETDTGTGRVLVVGSLNIDRTVIVDDLPRPGQTVTANRSFISFGGKGANQAVASARVGSQVTFVGSIGDDDSGREGLRNIGDAGVDTRWAVTDANLPTGTAQIAVSAAGENTIVVDAGANASLTPEALHAEQFDRATVLLMAMEVPDPVLVASAVEAKSRSIPVILNASPARPLPAELRAAVSVLVVNEDEFAALGSGTGLDNGQALAIATDIAIPVILVTVGADGVIIIDAGADDPVVRVPSIPVRAVDTTGCGDAFAGAFAAMLAKGSTLTEAVTFAAGYAALVATGEGAQSSYPTADAFEAWRRART